LDCLSEILGTGRSSYLYKKFVETRLAVQASVFHPCSELGGQFTMFVLPFPGQTLTDFEEEMRKGLVDFENEGVSEEAIQKFKARRESTVINRLATVSGKVSQLASYQTFTGDPNRSKQDLQRYLDVTKDDVVRVYKKYLKDKAAVIQSVLPKGAGMEPSQPDNFTPPVSGDNPFPNTDYSGLEYVHTQSAFDRSINPPAGQAPLVQVPEFWLSEMSNGIRIIGTINDEIPSVTIRISINGGQKFDVYDPTKSGLASMTAFMMNESTHNYSAEEISVALEKLGSSISIYANRNETVISAQSLTKNLDATIELLEEKLFRPAFAQEDFDRLKKQQLEAIQAAEKNPEAIANLVFNKLTYGENHIFSLPTRGMIETVENIALSDIKDFYKNHYAPEITEVVIVGDLDKEQMLDKMAFMGKWENKNAEIPTMTRAPEIEKTRLYLMDKQEAPQSQIRVGYMTDMTYDATGEYFKSTLMNYNLGGNFNSRLNLNLREDKGWTYGARSYFSSGDDPGPFYFSSGIKGNATDSAVYEVMGEITKFQQDGITDEELEFMKNSIGQRDALNYEAPDQKAGFLRRILHYNLDKDYVKKQNEIINSITKEEIDALAKKHLAANKMNIVVVGDKASIIEGLNRLEYEIVEVDSKGNILSETNLELNK
jgi:zinc protease